ncbi:sodium:solute symporter family protein [Polyangium sp. y55x31]|uniref:sodium:solute symporter family protein n=1 Tax=Polyangium sp. y55x31 TaxID=3042688 RepID=UPI002482A46C|nr:sodium:solute symporter family protein [Polyangium sp. y55x31]MDI1475505.1 sodium:solute symporter family protein [Polyangium sp. y55x31]
MSTDRLVTLLIVAGYLLALILAGTYVTRRTKGFSDYVTGGGKIPAWMLALSFMANFVSSNSFVGHAGKSHEVGLGWCVVGGFLVVACALSFHLFAPRFAEFARTNGALTLPDFFERRFGSRPLAVFVQWIIVATTLLYVLAVLRGTALVVASGLGLSYSAALLVVYLVTIVYCLLGGLWADVLTDVVQSVVLLAGAVLLFVGVLSASPDPGAPAPPPIRPLSVAQLVAVGLSGAVKLVADPKQVMVFYAFGDGARARRFRHLAPLLLLLVLGCLFPVGYFARSLVPLIRDADEVVPRLVFERGLLGAAFGPVFLVALLAASMSSLDSALLVVASCLEKHVVAPLARREPSERRTRFILFLVATLVLALSFRPLGDIVSLSTLAGALLGASLLPLLCVGLFVDAPIPPRVALVSLTLGVLGALAGKLGPKALGLRSPWLQDIFVGLLLATLPLVIHWVRRPRASVSVPG